VRKEGRRNGFKQRGKTLGVRVTGGLTFGPKPCAIDKG